MSVQCFKFAVRKLMGVAADEKHPEWYQHVLDCSNALFEVCNAFGDMSNLGADAFSNIVPLATTVVGHIKNFLLVAQTQFGPQSVRYPMFQSTYDAAMAAADACPSTLDAIWVNFRECQGCMSQVAVLMTNAFKQLPPLPPSQPSYPQSRPTRPAPLILPNSYSQPTVPTRQGVKRMDHNNWSQQEKKRHKSMVAEE